MQEEDGLAWRVSPEITERLDRIAALGIDDLMDVTSTPDARAAAANAPAEEEDADEEGDHPQTSDATIAAIGAQLSSVQAELHTTREQLHATQQEILAMP